MDPIVIVVQIILGIVFVSSNISFHVTSTGKFLGNRAPKKSEW